MGFSSVGYREWIITNLKHSVEGGGGGRRREDRSAIMLLNIAGNIQ